MTLLAREIGGIARFLALSETISGLVGILAGTFGLNLNSEDPLESGPNQALDKLIERPIFKDTL
jgi:hypothetical protein